MMCSRIKSLSSLVFGAAFSQLSFIRVPASPVSLRLTNSVIIQFVFSPSALRNMTLQTNFFDTNRNSQ